jgi:AmmeMemoRadiSam system protein B
MAIDEDLASAVLTACSSIREDEEPHLVEHSIEVQVPFLQYLAPTARLLPILVPHVAPGPAIGRAVAEQAKLIGREVAYVGSTDLTHYGPRYGFTPKGVGEAGLRWARNVSDRHIIDLICRMQADEVAPQARRHHNACGAGAVAATIAACRQRGATRGLLLHHTTSNETLRGRFGLMEDAVGYAGIVFTSPMMR